MKKWSVSFGIEEWNEKMGYMQNILKREIVETENKKDIKGILQSKYPTFKKIDCTKEVREEIKQ